jgi:glucose/arabinose dehydrogenase
VDFLSAFLSADGKAYGRPVGVALDRRGALLVADDVGGRGVAGCTCRALIVDEGRASSQRSKTPSTNDWIAF